VSAKSSIHIANGHAGYLAHNDRSQKTVNRIFPHNKNELWNTKEEGFKLFKFELTARSAAYTKRTKQNLQKKATTHLSAIVNLNEHHTLEDVKKVASLLEHELDTKVFQIALHRDEGHVADDGKEIVNYHAHIEFLGLDQEGRSVRQKLKRKTLMNLQSDTAMILDMERGTNYAKERKPRPKRLDTYEYKAHKTEESKTVKAKQKDLKLEISSLKSQLADGLATREQYAQLENLNRQLKERIRQKDLTVQQMVQDIEQLKHNLHHTEEQNQALKLKIATLPTEDTFEELKMLKSDFEDLKQENYELYELAYEEDMTREVDDYGIVHDRAYSYKELYEQKNNEATSKDEYIQRLESGYSQIQTKLFGKDSGLKVEEIVEKVGNQFDVMMRVIKNVAKHLNLSIEELGSKFNKDVPKPEKIEDEDSDYHQSPTMRP
jgi:hypothetical protein